MHRSTITTALADLAEVDGDYAGFLFDDDAPALPEGELARVLADPQLAAELAEVRKPRPEPTTAYADGSARRVRDARIAAREAQVRRLLAEVAELLAAEASAGVAEGRAA